MPYQNLESNPVVEVDEAFKEMTPELQQAYGCPLSDNAIKRVVQFYSRRSSPAPSHSTWGMIFDSCQKKFHEILSEGDVPTIRKELEHLYDGPILHGVDIPKEYADSQWPGEAYPQFIKSTIASCAIELGLPTPETLADAVLSIEKCLGVDISIRQSFGACGLIIDTKMIQPRVAHYAVLFKTLASMLPNASVLEIGPGTGGLSALALQITGITWHARDLFIMASIFAFLSMSKMGEDKVWLSGELKDRCFPVHVHGLGWPDAEMDVVVNQDSIVEFLSHDQIDCVKSIERVLRKKGKFVSVNHELATHIGDVVSANTNLKLISRKPALPLRAEGYFEQIWEKE